MRDFFHGWRRKVGCVSLVMACAFASAWVRSLTIADLFAFHVASQSYDCFSSSRYGIGWNRWTSNTPNILSRTPRFKWAIRYDKNLKSFEELLLTPPLRWEAGLLFVRIGHGKERDYDLVRGSYFIMPHAFVVIPLTLLSAYLLLWKPRRRPFPNHADSARNPTQSC